MILPQEWIFVNNSLDFFTEVLQTMPETGGRPPQRLPQYMRREARSSHLIVRGTPAEDVLLQGIADE